MDHSCVPVVAARSLVEMENEMNPADIYWAYQELYRIAPTLTQEEYLKRDRELYKALKAIQR